MRNIMKYGNVVKGLLKLKFTVSPIRDDKYILAKLKIFRKKYIATFNNNSSVKWGLFQFFDHVKNH